MNSNVDLHMHSAASDGSDMIPELLAKIQQLGITTFKDLFTCIALPAAYMCWRMAAKRFSLCFERLVQ